MSTEAHLTDEMKNYSATKSAFSMVPCGNLDVLGEMEMFVVLCVLYGCWRYSGFVSWVWVGCGVGCVFGCAWRCLQWPRLCRWWSLPKPDGQPVGQETAPASHGTHQPHTAHHPHTDNTTPQPHHGLLEPHGLMRISEWGLVSELSPWHCHYREGYR